MEPGPTGVAGVSPVGTSVVQSTACESIRSDAPAPASVNFTGTVAPAFTSFSVGAASIGGWKAPNVAAVQLAGRSNASVPSVRFVASP